MKNCRFKRLTSLLMVMILIFSSLSSAAYAASGEQAENFTFLPQEPSVKALPASRLTDLEGQDAVYFGSAVADLEEKDKYYSIRLYREGDLSGEASVSILTLDVSASYGKDYELSEEDVYVAEEQQTLLQKGNGSGAILTDEEALAQAEKLSEAYEKLYGDESSEADASETEGEERAEGSSSALSGTEKEETELGDFTASLLEDLNIETEEEVDEELLSEKLSGENLDYSAGKVIRFAAGEGEKTVTFHVMDDETEEGQEMFLFVLADAEGTVIRQQYTFSAVIEDNEELHDAEIAFTKESYSSENGQVTVKVSRSGSAYSVIDFYVKSCRDTAVPGENYEEFNELITMQPYQTEAEYTFDVSGRGRMEVKLVPDTACTVTGSDLAEVLIDVQETEGELKALRESEEAVDAVSEAAGLQGADASWQTVTEEDAGEGSLTGAAASTGTKKFSIYANDGKKYTVKYEVTETAGKVRKGQIIDPDFEKYELVVGDYYFTSDEFFQYGLRYGYDSPRTAGSCYQAGDKPGENAYAHLWWYTRTHCRTGGSWMRTKGSDYFINTLLYQQGKPDWEGCDSSGYWHKFRWALEIPGGKWYEGSRNHEDQGKFARNVDGTVAINLLNHASAKADILAYAEDNGSARNYNDLKIYGFAFFYKRYGIVLEEASGLDFRTAKGGTLQKLKPFTLKIASSVVQGGGDYIYLNETGERTTLVFETDPARVNGKLGVFGKIASWDITYDYNGGGEPEKRTVNYPEDFKKFLTGQEGAEYRKNSVLDYKADTISTYIENQVNASLTRIVFDSYFAEWLQYLDNKFFGERNASGVNLYFAPNIVYNTVQVKICDAPDGQKGTFNDTSLAVRDEYYELHAGDSYDLTATSGLGGMVQSGYQVSENEGIDWNTVTSTKTYTIPGDYEGTIWLRPIFSDSTNHIEVSYLNGAEDLVEVQGLISQDLLKNTSFKGLNILDINTEKSSAADRMRPETGVVYTLDIVTKKQAPSGYVYRPYVLLNAGGTNPKKIYTRSFPVVAKSRARENAYSIGAELVAESSLKTYEISGNVYLQSIRSKVVSADPTKRTPASGTLLIASGNEQEVTSENPATHVKTTVRLVNKQSAVADLSGNFKLTGVEGCPGDTIVLLASSELGNGSVRYVELPSDGSTSVSAGALTMAYPYSAPEVVSVNYRFEDPSHGQETFSDTIYIYDDKLYLNVVIDEKQRKAKEVRLVLYHANKTKAGEIANEVKEYPLVRQGDTDTWTAEIPSMNKYILSGDRLCVSVTDSEKKKIYKGKDANGQAVYTEVDMVYPVMDTGYQFAEKVVMPNPQWYQRTMEPTEKINIPLAGGDGSPGVTSGVLNFSQVDFEGGYTRSVGIGLDVNPLDIWNKANRVANYQKSVLVAQKASAKEAISKYKTEYKNLSTYQKACVDAGTSEANARLLAGNTQISAEKLAAAKADLGDIKKQLAENTKARSKLNSWLDNPKGLDTETMGGGGITFCIALQFVKAGDKYIYACGNLSFGFTIWAEHTKFKLFMGKIPAYINVGGVLQGNYTETYTTKKGAAAMSANMFAKVGGNVSQVIATSAGKQDANFMIGLNGHVTLGLGLKDVVSVAGVVNAGWQAFIPTYKHPVPQNATPQEIAEIQKANQTGHILNFSGGIEVTLLLFTLKFDVVTVNKGFGSMAGETQFVWANGLHKGSLTGAELEEAIEKKELEILSEDGNEVLSLVKKSSGTADMSAFGQAAGLLGADGDAQADDDYAWVTTLLEDSADNAQIRTVATDDKGSLFMTYVGNRSESAEADALYWTFYDAEKDSWTTPALLDENGTYESVPDLWLDDADSNDLQLTVTWSSVEEALEEGEDTAAYLANMAKFRIKASVFRITKDGEGKQTVTQTVAPVFLSGKTASASVAEKETGVSLHSMTGTAAAGADEKEKQEAPLTEEAGEETAEETAAEEIREEKEEVSAEERIASPSDAERSAEDAEPETKAATEPETDPEDEAETEPEAETETGAQTGAAAALTGSGENTEEKAGEETDEEAALLGEGSGSKYYDADGWTWYDAENQKFYSAFTRYDLSTATTLTDLLNPAVTVPGVFYAEYDLGEQDTELERTGVLTELWDISLTAGESLLNTADTELIEVPELNDDGEPTGRTTTFMTIVYTQDTDGDLATEEDNELKLCLIEYPADGSDPVVYPSMDISWENGTSEYAKGEELVLGSGYQTVEEQEEFDPGSELMQVKDYTNDPDGDGNPGIALSNAELTEIGGEYWLTYLKDGYLFEMINIGTVLEEMFGQEYLADLYRNRALTANGGLTAAADSQSGLQGADGEPEKWYEVDMDDLNKAWAGYRVEQGMDTGEEPDRFITMEEACALEEAAEGGDARDPQNSLQGTDDPAAPEPNASGYVNYTAGKAAKDTQSEQITYETTAMYAVSQGEFNTNETCLTGDTESRTAITDYQLVSDGTDVYIVYTDYVKDSTEAEKELFCVKRNLGWQPEEARQPGDKPVGKDTDEAVYYSKPVQLTDLGHVIGSFKAGMSKDASGNNVITVHAECYDQWVPAEGGIRFSEKSIIKAEYTAKALPKVQESTVSAQVLAEDGTVRLSLDYAVANEGTEPQNGYKTKVLLDGEKIYEAERTGYLRSGDTDTFHTDYGMDGFTQSRRLDIIVTDANGIELSRYETVLTPEAKRDAVITAVSRQENGDYLAKVTVSNSGSLTSEAGKLKLRILNTDYSSTEELKVYREVEVPALAAGESRELEIRFLPGAEDFSEIGTIDLEAVFEGEDAGASYTYVGEDPDMAVIEDGAASLKLSCGTTRQLKVEAAPFPEETGTVLYYSENPEVASIDANGVLKLNKNGTTTVYAYLTDWGYADDIAVIVKDQGTDDRKDNDSDDSWILPSYVDNTGTWKVDASDNWTYTTRAGVQMKNCWLAIARATFNGGNGFEWFRFDKDGFMVTGWFRDSDDRMYYLQTVSDGNRGRMLTGWQLLDGKWYCFNTVSNGYKGALFVNCVTPDGYTVGADGVWDGKPAKTAG